MLRGKLICGAVLTGLLAMIATTAPAVTTAEAASFKQKFKVPLTTKRPLPGNKWLPPNPCRRSCRR